MQNLEIERYELDVLIDALRDYADGAERYEADDSDAAELIIEFGITARGLIARAETLRQS